MKAVIFVHRIPPLDPVDVRQSDAAEEVRAVLAAQQYPKIQELGYRIYL